MNFHHSDRTRVRRGFSLVATVTMLLLLIVLAVGMLSLAAVELRVSGREMERSVARANARIALVLAVGQLQQAMGPDARVSATAEQMDGDPATAEIDGVAHPHWTGVWRSARREGDRLVTPWEREEGSLVDRRFGGEGEWDEPVGWLVSGGTGFGVVDPRNADGEMVEMLVTGSDEVRVPTIGVDGGRIGWWTADESQKAKLNIPDPRHDRKPDPAAPAGGGYWRLLAASDVAPGLLGDTLEIEEKSKSRLLTRASIDLLKGADTGWAARHFHDVTTHSLGLAVNVREGRLKRDLSAWVESNGSIPDLEAGGEVLVEGLDDADRMVGAANGRVLGRRGLDAGNWKLRNAAPRFGLLRNWARRGGETAFSLGRRDAVAPERAANAPGATQSAYDGTNAIPVKIEDVREPSISPVLVEASIYYHLAAKRIGDDRRATYGMQALLYPRVALWNPYNIEIEVDPSMVMLHINGLKQVRVTYERGRRVNLKLPFGWERGGGLHAGSLFFALSGVRIPAGECLVLSPPAPAPYQGVPLERNRLTPGQPPSPDRYFSLDLDVDEERFAPESFVEIGDGLQAEDLRVVWKALGSVSGVGFAAFDRLPQLGLVSCALQYGDEKELPVRWSELIPAPVMMPDSQGRLAALEPPDVRTRDGYRMRWLDEHVSNQLGSGSLAGTHHFETALLANWNPRASFVLRTPWENLTDSEPTFFGNYTRDLFDGAVSWQSMQPVPRGGGFASFPFGTPDESPGPVVLFDLPRRETGLLSLGQLQHLDVSRFAWHPTYAIGNSLADPRLERHTERTVPVPGTTADEQKHNGWNIDLIGHDKAGRTDGPEGLGAWAYYARWLVLGVPESEPVNYDLSYELNHSLWDDFHFSSGDRRTNANFVRDPAANPLPNSRIRLLSPVGDRTAMRETADFHRAAYHLGIDGAFNVNSTRVEAWKAVLGATRGLGPGGGATFPRLLNPPDGVWNSDQPANHPAAWAGSRELDDEEIQRLAEAIVAEVKQRGPFLSLADFVNRRLFRDETSRMGTLQAAIERAGLNRAFEERWPLRQETLPDYRHRDNIANATRIDHALMPASRAWGAAGYLTQADLLQTLGPVLTVRSDTFVVRAYGESTGNGGRAKARAWCEAVVQRVPEPLDPDGSGINPREPGGKLDFGRRFEVVAFRWLSPEEL